MDVTPRVVRATRVEVGRIISGSKIKYEWTVRVGDAVVQLVFKDSKSSKRKRLVVNGQECLSELSKDAKYEAKASFEQHMFVIFPENGVYRLKIDGVVDRTPVIQLKYPDPEPSSQESLNWERVNGVVRISAGPNSSRSVSGSYPVGAFPSPKGERRSDLEPPRQPPALRPPSAQTPKSPTNGPSAPADGYNTSPANFQRPNFGLGSDRAVPTTPFEALNDSGDLYRLTQYYMMIREPMENENLVRAINRVK